MPGVNPRYVAQNVNRLVTAATVPSNIAISYCTKDKFFAGLSFLPSFILHSRTIHTIHFNSHRKAIQCATKCSRIILHQTIGATRHSDAVLHRNLYTLVHCRYTSIFRHWSGRNSKFDELHHRGYSYKVLTFGNRIKGSREFNCVILSIHVILVLVGSVIVIKFLLS